MSRSILAVVGLGSIALGALAAGSIVAMTPGIEPPLPMRASPQARANPVVRREPETAASPPRPASFAPIPAVAATCQPLAPPPPSAPPARLRAPPVETVHAEKHAKPPLPLVAAVKTRVTKAVALLLPSRKPTPAVPRVDHRYDGVLTVAEIGRIKGALHLTSDQEPYWPPIADLLKMVGRRQASAIQAGQPPEVNLGGDLMRFYYAARPLLQSLREDQKTEVRRLARQMGFSSVASYI